jgi:uncharacterized membrane protein YeaQ/YmgE (transglycosylase-associated protein family)
MTHPAFRHHAKPDARMSQKRDRRNAAIHSYAAMRVSARSARSPRCDIRSYRKWEASMSGIIWIIVVGFVAGIIARFLSPGPNKPTGFILTTVLGIAGAFLATFIGQTLGWYRLDQGAGFIAATIGALLVLFIWNRLVAHNVISDPGR